MFSLFKKKESGPTVNDLVFAKKQGKWSALLEASRRNPQPVFVAWFEKSMEDLQNFLQQHGQEANVLTFRQVHSGMIGDKPVIFIEHYPLPEKEQEVFSSLAGNQVSVYSSLDEAFFKHFGGDKISGLLDKLGLQENEAISHTMITKSISNAQEKLATKVTVDQSAYSMEEWMQKMLEPYCSNPIFEVVLQHTYQERQREMADEALATLTARCCEKVPTPPTKVGKISQRKV